MSTIDSFPLHIVLVEPEIAENTGNVGRTCVALGAKLWLVRPLGFRLDEHRLRRSGMDYWQRLSWEAVDCWDELAPRLPPRRWFFSKTAAGVYHQAAFARGDALVFGSESRGLPPTLLAAADAAQTALRIPQGPAVRSLNLAVAVGIAAYEASRQVGFGPGVG